MPSERKPRFVSDAAQASNPGRLKVQLWVYYRCFPRVPAAVGACLIVCGAAAFWSPPAWVISGVLVGRLAITDPARVKEHFWYGCINPALIVSHDPDLIAVYSDLDAGAGPYPVVKVLPHPLKRMAGGRPAVGTRLATVALYAGRIRRPPARLRSGAAGQPDSTAAVESRLPPRWTDFHPLAVNCATADLAEIERVLASIGEREWEAMAAALPQIPTPPQPGLYPVELPPHLLWT